MEDNSLLKITPTYFSQEEVDEAYMMTTKENKTKEETSALCAKLKKSYSEKDTVLKVEIKNKLATLKTEYNKEVVSINENMKVSLAEAEKKYKTETPTPTKAETKAYLDIKNGIEIQAKRAKKKALTDYNENIKNTKLERYFLHSEYIKLVYYVTRKVSPVDTLKSKTLEDNANFNFKSTITNGKTYIGLVPLFMLILMIAAYFIGRNATGYQGDLSDIINKGIFVAVVATGAVFIYSQGGFDMSLGNASLMCATITAIMYNATGNIFLSLVVSIFVGAILGVINAILATILNLPVMVMTLTMMNIISAVHEAILSSYGGLISVNDGMISSPWAFATFLLIFFIICWFIFNYSKVGRRNKFIGSNKTAAKFNGINLMKAGIISFAISGIGLGICGFLFAASKTAGKFGAATVLSQVGLDVVIAIVFGGMTTSGGPKSKVSCAMIGAFFAVFLDEFFNAISTPTFQVGNYAFMVKGIVFILVSLFNMWDTRGKMLASGGSIQ